MTQENPHKIGVSEKGASYSCIVLYDDYSCGPTRKSLLQVREILSQEDVLGAKSTKVHFRQHGDFDIRIIAPDLESVKAARDALIEHSPARDVKQL